MSVHFIRPEWFWALLPLALIIAFLWRKQQQQSPWQSYIAPHLSHLLVDNQGQTKRKPLSLLIATWLLTTLALAGPALEQKQLPVFSTNAARVIIMDMSLSMYATDITPNRLTQAKFRATDLIQNLHEGETALIAYAGDAFVISPMTTDKGTLLNLLPTLSPDIMPVRGSDLSAAITLAQELLTQSGHQQGDIVLITDGISAKQFDQSLPSIEDSNYRLAILAVGTAQGAPITLPNGQLMRDNANEVVIAKTEFGLLSKLAKASDGMVVQLQYDSSDLSQLTQWLSNRAAQEAKQTERFGETWLDLGGYLALLLLLPVLWLRRTGILALPLCLLFLPSDRVHAMSWQDLWQTADQQAQQAYQAQDYQTAAEQFEDQQWQASAAYKAGDYQTALDGFKQDQSAQGWYNQGNALLQLEQIDQAIKAYQQALNQQADFADAQHNLALAEQMKQQLQEQEQQEQEQRQQPDQQGSEQQTKQQQGAEQQEQQQNADQQGSDQPQAEQQNQAGAAEQNQQQGQGSEQQQGAHQQNQQPPASQSQDASAQDQSQNQGQQANGLPQSQEAGGQHDFNAEHEEQASADDQSDQAMNSSEPANDAPMQATPTPEKKPEQTSNEQASALSNTPSSAQPAGEAANEPTEQAPNSASVAPVTQSQQPLPEEMQRALRSVVDNPQVLLRNKMQLEYEKRRIQGQLTKEDEQW